MARIKERFELWKQNFFKVSWLRRTDPGNPSASPPTFPLKTVASTSPYERSRSAEIYALSSSDDSSASTSAHNNRYDLTSPHGYEYNTSEVCYFNERNIPSDNSGYSRPFTKRTN